jgi:hypothetical protein
MSRHPEADTCPLCGKPSQAQFRPFCSQGCRDRDLLNWLGDAYRVPAAPAEDEDGTDGLDREARPPL